MKYLSYIIFSVCQESIAYPIKYLKLVEGLLHSTFVELDVKYSIPRTMNLNLNLNMSLRVETPARIDKPEKLQTQVEPQYRTIKQYSDI